MKCKRGGNKHYLRSIIVHYLGKVQWGVKRIVCALFLGQYTQLNLQYSAPYNTVTPAIQCTV